MKVALKQVELAQSGADLVAVGLFEDDRLPQAVAAASGAEAGRGGFEKLSLLRPEGLPPVLVVGLGKRDEIDAEKLRVAAARAAKESARLEAGSLARALPQRDDRGAGDDAPRLESLTLLAPAELEDVAAAATVIAEAQNRARDLQLTPANVATPSFLAERATEIAAGFEAIDVEILGRAELENKGMGGLLAVSQGGPQEPKLIVLRYSGGGFDPTPAYVGQGGPFEPG